MDASKQQVTDQANASQANASQEGAAQAGACQGAFECERVYNICVQTLEAYAHSLKNTDAVVGLSGGIDSALVCAMAVDAFGAEHVHAVLLPGPHTSQDSIDDALDCSRRLGVDTQTVSIEGIYSKTLEALGGAIDFSAASAEIARQNIQARCRMVCLMALSNAHGWMLLNTGNKSEACMGYSTLYGDMAGSFAPIGSLYKTEVFAMCRWLNERAAQQGRTAVIPETIIAKKPSAELADRQSDEDSLGISYQVLDQILQACERVGQDRRCLVELGFAEADVDNVLDRLYASAWKQKYYPAHPIY